MQLEMRANTICLTRKTTLKNTNENINRKFQLKPNLGIRAFSSILLFGAIGLGVLSLLGIAGRIQEPIFDFPGSNWATLATSLLFGWVCLQCHRLRFSASNHAIQYRGFLGFTKYCKVEDVRGYTVDRQRGNFQIHLFNKQGKMIALLSPNWFSGFEKLAPWLEGFDELSLCEATDKGKLP